MIDLANLRLGFACKERWEDMVGDDRVRACAACDRQVFNLSAMTREAAERLLAARGVTPCVRFYRRPDGTVMTADCPTGERHTRHRLAVVSSSLAAGAALAAPAANAEDEPLEVPPETIQIVDSPPVIEHLSVTMGIPVHDEVGIIIDVEPPRAAVEWSLWGRVGLGFTRQLPDDVARRVTPPEAEAATAWQAALAADITFGIARDGKLRVGAFGELRTSSDPVAGAELVVHGLPPRPWTSRIGGTGSLVVRFGGNARIVTTAVGVGYVGSFSRRGWAKHIVGARILASVDRSRDDPREWSATFGLEVEPIGALQAVLELAR